MAKQSIQNLLKQADLHTQEEIKIILDAFDKWYDLFQEVIVAGNTAKKDKLVELTSRTASQVSFETIMYVAKSTTEGTLNNTFLATLIVMKQRQAS